MNVPWPHELALMKSIPAMVMIVGAAWLAQPAGDLLRQADDAAKAGKLDEAIALVGKALVNDPKNAKALGRRATLYEASDRYKEAVADLTRLFDLDPKDADTAQRRGIAHFKAGEIDASIRDFDRYIELRPEQKVRHWQRGISYYYAGRFDDGRQQFEGYQEYDSNDVENAVWRFMCMARKDGVDKARKAILKIGDDRRVPMRQVYDLFKGELKPDDVLTAARAGKPTEDALNSRLFYAHLYVGIYYDLLSDRKQALAHLNDAVKHRIGHYMWDVARVHRDLLEKK
jgi:lipoprotein NlpI